MPLPLVTAPADVLNNQFDLIRLTGCLLAVSITLRPLVRSFTGCYSGKLSLLGRIFVINNVIHAILFAGTAIYPDFIAGQVDGKYSQPLFFMISFRPFNLLMRILCILIVESRASAMNGLADSNWMLRFWSALKWLVIAAQCALYTSKSGIQIAAQFVSVSDEKVLLAHNLDYVCDLIFDIYILLQQTIFIIRYIGFIKSTAETFTRSGNRKKKLLKGGTKSSFDSERDYRILLYVVETVVIFFALISSVLSYWYPVCDAISDIKTFGLTLCCVDVLDLSESSRITKRETEMDSSSVAAPGQQIPQMSDNQLYIEPEAVIKPALKLGV